jgi:hypothetical protein
MVLRLKVRAYTLSHSTSPFWWKVFQDRVLQTSCWSWLATAILLIPASWIARITGMSHWHPVKISYSFLLYCKCNCFLNFSWRLFIVSVEKCDWFLCVNFVPYLLNLVNSNLCVCVCVCVCVCTLQDFLHKRSYCLQPKKIVFLLVWFGCFPQLEMKEVERWLKRQHRVYCSGRSPVEGDPSKRAGAHSCLQTWSRYRGVVWRSGGEILLGGKILQ